MKKTNKKQIAAGNEIKLKRAETKLTQAELAVAIGCSRQTILNVEAGQIHLKNGKYYRLIMSYFDTLRPLIQDFDKLLYNSIAYERQKRNLTQAELASAVNSKRHIIIDIESGKLNPSLIIAYAIAEFFNKKVADIFKFKTE